MQITHSKPAPRPQGKIKKHDAFKAEVHANENALNSLKTAGEELIAAGNFAEEAITAKSEALNEQWRLLLDAVEDKTAKLQQAQQLVSFRREADELDAFIRSKATVASDTDIGKDLEHVEMLQKKFEDFTQDLNASDGRVDALSNLALELTREGHPEMAAIQAREQVSA